MRQGLGYPGNHHDDPRGEDPKGFMWGDIVVFLILFTCFSFFLIGLASTVKKVSDYFFDRFKIEKGLVEK